MANKNTYQKLMVGVFLTMEKLYKEIKTKEKVISTTTLL